MKLAPLVSVCTIEMGQAPNGSSYNEDGIGLPLLAGASDLGQVTPAPSRFTDAPTKICQPGDLILCIRATIGDLNVADRRYCLGRGVAALRPSPGRLDNRYLWHWITASADILRSMGRGATFLQISKKDLSSLQIPLPPLAEQRRIAAILDAADSLRRKRRESLELLKGLDQSVFLEMLGDPVTNPKGWDRLTGSAVSERITVGVVVKPASYYVDDGVPALRSLNVRPNRIDLDDMVYFSPEDSAGTLKKSELCAGDVVMVRSGKPGTAAVVPDSLDGANAIDILIFTPARDLVLPEYIAYFMNSSGGERAVVSSQRGQIQKHLNVGSLRETVFPIPPLTEQRRWVGRMREIEKVKALHQTQVAELDTLFASLQSRAFRGEL